MDPIQWVTNKPTKITTPYGEQLKWTMPYKTEVTIHLKDKDKIRHKKRWSQVKSINSSTFLKTKKKNKLLKNNKLNNSKKNVKCADYLLVDVRLESFWLYFK